MKLQQLLKQKRFMDSVLNSFNKIGEPQIKSYLKNIGESSCKWCPYKDNQELCDKVTSS